MTKPTKPNQLPFRMIRCENNDKLIIKQCSHGLSLLIGAKIQNNKEPGSFLDYVYAGDQKRILEQIVNAVQNKEVYETRCRLITASGSPLWTLCQINANSDTVMMNFTEIHDMVRTKIRLQRRVWFYRAILNETVDYVFRYDPQANAVSISSKGASDGQEGESSKGTEYSMPETYVHPDDREIINETLQSLLNGGYSINLEVRAKVEKDSYHWFRIQGIISPVPNSRIPAVIGTLTDIDKEKNAIMRLTEQARTDSLTGLSNKAEAQSAVDTYLKNSTPEDVGALLVIDIDNFKKYNDTKGHLFGDAVLVSVSDILKRCFNSSDIVGRLGGDEFIAFMKNIPSFKITEEKASEVISALKNIPMNDGSGHSAISCSIGIAVSPKHGRNFKELFQNADAAMYQAKVAGKSRFSFFDNNLLNRSKSIQMV